MDKHGCFLFREVLVRSSRDGKFLLPVHLLGRAAAEVQRIATEDVGAVFELVTTRFVSWGVGVIGRRCR